MNIQLKNKTDWTSWSRYLVPILIALAFFTFTFLYFPFREKIQFDGDEGLNLMRSMLVVLGHPLYSAVSSDQPPLLTYLLALLMRLNGFSVAPARLLVLLFSTLLVWAWAQFLQIAWGKLSAIAFLPLVVLAPRYLVLSVSVMIGLPSLALASVSMLFVVFWHQKKNDWWLVFSGFALASSMLIKLFTGFLAPIFVIGVTAAAYLAAKEKKLSWKLLRPALIWGLSFAILGIALVLILVGPQNLWQIIFPHLDAPTESAFKGENYTINYHLQTAVPLLILGFFGGLYALYRRNWLTLYPIAWLALAYTFLSFYSPVLYHHQLLITVPMAMLAAAFAGGGLGALLRVRRPADLIHVQTLLGITALIGFGLITANYWQVVSQDLVSRPRFNDFALKATAGKLKVLNTMSDYIDQTHWIVTDMPMYAYLVHRPVPPTLATFSRKRLVTGSLTEEDILAALREYQPEQVLMARFTIPAVETYLQAHYTLIASPEYFRLFLRNDIQPKSQ